MKNIYQTIKQTARKYALPAIVAGGLAFGSCSNKETSYFPISQEVMRELIQEKTKYLDSLVNEAEKNVYDARRLFNQGIKKRSLDSLAMEQTLSKYQKADSLYSVVRNDAKRLGFEKYTKVSINEKDKKLMNGHHKVLYRVDFGKAELQKDLEKQGFNVDVYNPYPSKKENNLMNSILLAMCAGAVGLIFLTKKYFNY